MPILSAQDIKEQLIREASKESEQLSENVLASAGKHIEVGTAIRRMTQSTGWKILEFWLLNQLDINGLLNAEDEKLHKIRAEGKAYAKVLSQVEQWIRLADRLEKEKERTKKKEE